MSDSVGRPASLAAEAMEDRVGFKLETKNVQRQLIEVIVLEFETGFLDEGRGLGGGVRMRTCMAQDLRCIGDKASHPCCEVLV